MKDEAALINALATDPRYDASVIGGSNSKLLALLNAPDPTVTKKLTPISRKQLLNAIGAAALKALSSVDRERLRLVIMEDPVPLDEPEISSELLDIFAGQRTVVARVAAIAQVTPSYVEAFGYKHISLQELWSALRQVPKSHLATYLRAG